AKFESLVVASDPVSIQSGNGASSDAALKASAVIPVGGTIGNMVLSPNRKWLFFLNRTNDQLVQIDTATLTATRTWALPDGCEALTLTRDGKAIFLAGTDQDRPHVFELDPVSLSVRKKFRVETQPYDLAATDGGLVFLSGAGGGWSDVSIYDAKKQS